MIDHDGLNVADLDEEKAFYSSRRSRRSAIARDGLLRVRARSWDSRTGDKASSSRVGARDPRGTARTSPSSAADRATVDSIPRGGTRCGRQRTTARPAFATHYHEHYYGAFVHDADGNNIEAVCQAPQ